MENKRIYSNRREFIVKSAATLSGVLLSFDRMQAVNILGENTTDMPCVHVFSKHLHWLSYEKLAETCAEAGFGGIDLTVRPGGHVLPENVETDLPKAIEAARRYGLKVDMITSGITSATDRYTEPIIKVAAHAGVKFYRTGWLTYEVKDGIMSSLQKHRNFFQELEAINKQYKIHGAYQNHSGTSVGSPVWDLYELLKGSDPAYIGCQYDVRHAMVEGGTSWPLGMELLFPWIKCTDIKDFVWSKTNGSWEPESVPLGEGMVNFKEYFGLVQKFGISGPISMHYEYPLLTPSEENGTEADKRRKLVEVMKKDLTTLKSFLQ